MLSASAADAVCQHKKAINPISAPDIDVGCKLFRLVGRTYLDPVLLRVGGSKAGRGEIKKESRALDPRALRP